MISQEFLHALIEARLVGMTSDNEDDQLAALLLELVIESNYVGSLRDLGDTCFDFARFDKNRKKYRP